ncbi:DUF4214 domain-containing protein [Sulfuricurvum sp.]|uniref:DUF4214 domain-containing protein n=1 Tax=Sulfuricurvum sp. TaxID=2025608 RepID=UPI00260EBF2B|nr:DUF4214 domain-containing protein [Sulfuricurvum sp.]MDD2266041.1 DUF4214 domain-containing protein [Sulfuricurvum sp.]MDD2783053.1 DUF4214 domain-containing protein [Sulfuricurvum sp.]
MAITNQSVAELYVATFNRAPDAAGLYYWVYQSGLPTLEDIAQSFFDQSETQAIYTPSMSVSEKITLAYQNLFNRSPDSDGLAYWVQQLTTHTISQSNMLIALINGAHAPTGSTLDANILDNKTAVGLYYAQANLNDVDLAVSVMTGVTGDSATAGSAIASIDTIANSTIFLDPASDTGVSHSDHIINQYNSVKVSLKLSQADSVVEFFDDLNGNNQQDAGEYINSVPFSRTATEYTALLDLVNQVVPDGSPLPDGVHAIKAMQLDTSGNLLAVSLPLNITLDTTAPVISNFGLPASEGSRISPEIFATNSFEFSLVGTTESNATVVLYDQWEVQLSATTADSNGNFSFGTVSVPYELHGHTYKFTARATDLAGNSPDQNIAPIWVGIDTDQPGSLLMWYDNSYEQIDLMTYVQRSKIAIGQTTGEMNGVTSWYSVNSGATWNQTTSQSPSFDIAPGQYAASQIQVKQLDAAGNSTGTTFNSNAFTISSSHDISSSLLLGYTPPDSSNNNANTVTVNLGNDHVLNNGDVFTFNYDVSQILSLTQVGEIIRFNNASLIPVSKPSDGLVSDQHYFAVRGSYNEATETFTQDDNYTGEGMATLVVFDGDQIAGAIKQQGMVLVGISPLHMHQNMGEIVLF